MKNLVKLLFLLAVTLSFCAAQTIGTYGVSPRDASVDATDIFDLAYNGVTNVGVGTKVYIKATVTDSAGFVSPTWAITKKPAGSVAAVIGTVEFNNSWYDTEDEEWNYSYTQVISLVADVKGEFEITFTNGTSDPVVQRIHTAKYLGVENCAACHSSEGYLVVDTKYDDWMTTGHADALERGLNGQKGDHFGANCVSCHSTGYDTNSDNDGFDDFAFVFPEHPGEGVYDEYVDTYQDAMARANIQCESCHGPGSDHLGNPGNIAVTMDSKNCAYCHDSGTHHVYPAQFDVSGHAAGNVLYASRSGCPECHNGLGFVQKVKTGTQSVTEKISISCATCHDPHSNAGENHQLRTVQATLSNGYEVTDGGMGRLCMNCHKSRRDAATYAITASNVSSHFGPHYSTQADMLIGENLALNGMTVQKNTGHYTFIEESCVGCHMFPGHVDEDNQVVLSGSHSFSMSTPDGVDNMAACTGCHPSFSAYSDFSDIPFDWNGYSDFDEDGEEEGFQHEIEGLLHQLAYLLPPYGEYTIDFAYIKANFTPELGVALYNHQMVEEDRSGGFHNPKLAVSLLQESIKSLGGIVSVNSPAIVPDEYRLSQNYPNPFNPTTTIQFGIPVESSVKLSIYNALGELVETLVDEVKGAGNHTVNFNASQLASGVYIYRLQADKFVQVKKMLLMK